MSIPELTFLSPGTDWQYIVGRLEHVSIYASDEWLIAASYNETKSKPELAVLRIGKNVLAFPYLVRPIPDQEGYFDICSAYEFGGIWFSSMSAKERKQLIHLFNELFVSEAKSKNYISAFIRINPWIHRKEFSSAFKFNPVFQQEHIWIDTTKTYESIRQDYTSKARNKLRQAESYNLVIDENVDMSIFLDLYYQRMKELKASKYYFFPKRFFESIKDNLYIFSVKEPLETVCAIHSYLIDPPYAYAFLCHSHKEFVKLRPNNFGYDHMARYASGRSDINIFHIGGGNPSLLSFKRSFSPLSVPSNHFRIIFDEVKYNALSERMYHTNRNFFPMYRTQ